MSELLLEEKFDASPNNCREFHVSLPADIEPSALRVQCTMQRALNWSPTPQRRHDAEFPEPAQAIAKPEEIDSNESLYLAGVHLEQYRHATRQAEDYFREALLRDPGDIRCNLALGRILYRRCQYRAAESLFRAAVERATRHNPNPANGESHYNLGLSLAAQHKFDDAEDAFYKSAWSAPYQDAAYFQLARISSRRGNWASAEHLLRRASTAMHISSNVFTCWSSH